MTNGRERFDGEDDEDDVGDGDCVIRRRGLLCGRVSRCFVFVVYASYCSTRCACLLSLVASKVWINL
jgi:hypothetical protein